MILLLYHYYDRCYQIHLILGSLHVNPCPCFILQQYLPQFILQDRLQGFIHQIICLNSLSCSPKWVFLVTTKILDTGQRRVVFQFSLVTLPSLQLLRIWVIQPNHCCEYISWCTSTLRSVLHLHLIPIRQYWECFLSSMCLLSLCIPCRRIQRK